MCPSNPRDQFCLAFYVRVRERKRAHDLLIKFERRLARQPRTPTPVTSAAFLEQLLPAVYRRVNRGILEPAISDRASTRRI
jgi:hypothetical protein